MESQSLFTHAKRFGVKALTIITASDNVFTREPTSAKDREQSFNNMIKIALETA